MDRVVWGTDALWTGSSQWQIEGLRRLEIPEHMQKKFGFAPLGAADGAVKNMIFGDNTARLYRHERVGQLPLRDKLSAAKATYEQTGARPANMRYGYIRRQQSR